MMVAGQLRDVRAPWQAGALLYLYIIPKPLGKSRNADLLFWCINAGTKWSTS